MKSVEEAGRLPDSPILLLVLFVLHLFSLQLDREVIEKMAVAPQKMISHNLLTVRSSSTATQLEGTLSGVRLR